MQPLSERDRDRLSRKFTVEFNYNSNHIEGNTLTYGQTELLLLFGKVVGEAEMKDFEEMKASNVGLLMMKEQSTLKNTPLTQTFIRQLHQTLLREDYTVYRTLPDGTVTSYVIHAGCYKTRPNSVITRYGDRFEYAAPEETTALMSYKKANRTQKILHNLKYKGQKEIGAILGEYFGGQLLTEERYRGIQYILPIPLHPKKQRKRGYNQSEWIAKGLSQGMGIPYLTDVQIRSQFTDTQTKKSRFARWQNVKEVFEVRNPEKIAYTHVLVCDDVLTTGATTEAAIRKLLDVPGIRVSVATLAATTL